MATGKLPSSTVVRLPGGPLEARPDLTIAEWALLSRVDGRRPLSALANRSGRGHGEAIALAERLIAAGVLELAGEPDEAAPPQRAAAPSAEPEEPVTAADGESAAEHELADATRTGEWEAGTEDEAGPQAEPELVAADAQAETELVGAANLGGSNPGDQPAAAGGEEEGGDGAPASGQARIDPVSLLRELAAAAEAPPAASEPEGHDDQDLAELAARLGGGPGEDQANPGVQEDRQAGDGPARAPGRGADQAEFLREFASLAMGGAPPEDSEAAPQSDEEPSDDDRSRGRFGFRRGQRR